MLEEEDERLKVHAWKEYILLLTVSESSGKSKHQRTLVDIVWCFMRSKNKAIYLGLVFLVMNIANVMRTLVD